MTFYLHLRPRILFSIGPALLWVASGALRQVGAADRPSATAGQVSGGLSAARRGHLSCLLQLGHLQALLAAVDGWMTRCPGESSNCIPMRTNLHVTRRRQLSLMCTHSVAGQPLCSR